MNKVYRVVWNASLGAWVAVSEIAKSKTKTKSIKTAVVGMAVLSLTSMASAADGNFDNINATGDIVAAGDVTAQNITALDGRVGQNETDITVLDSRVSQNETDITNNQTDITALDGRVGQNETDITALDGRVSQNETDITTNQTDISALDGRVGQNETDIGTNTTNISTNTGNIATNTQNISDNKDAIDEVLSDLGVDATKPGSGIKYFRANSTEPDAEANGEDSVAIGPNAKSEGDNSLAAGNGASTTEGAQGAIALGQGAQAGTVSLDPNFVDGEGSIAIGRNTVTGGTSSTAVGDGAKATASNSAAMGNNAQATGSSATALGANANASGGNSIALGNATAGSSNAFAAGNGAVANSPDSISLGTGAGVNTSGTVAADRRSQVAIGNKAGQNVTAKETIGIGFGAGSNVEGDNNMAIGTNAGTNINGEYNIAMGFEANKGAGVINHATVVGGKASAGSNSVALGYEAKADNTDSVALGNQAKAQAQGLALGSNSTAESNSVALGFNSEALASDSSANSYLTGSNNGAGVVSVGNTRTTLTRRIVNVADGAQGNDAVNVNQLKFAQRSVANLVGGGVLLNEDGSYGKIKLKDTGGATIEFDTIFDAVGSITDGTVDILPADAVKYNANGGISNVAAGIEGTDAVNVNQLNEKIAEEGVKYFSVNSTDGANRKNKGASGSNAIAIGPQAAAPGEESLALGYQARSEANTSVAIGKDVRAEGVQSTVLGNQSRVYGEKGVAIGHQAVSNGENSLVMGTGAKANEKSTGAKVDNAIVIGTSARSTASEDGIAIGRLALARENRAVAQGFNAESTADDAMAFGSGSRASGISSQASGTSAKASGLNAIAQGTEANASGNNASASGTKSNASGSNSIASGKDSNSYATDGVAIGTGAVSGISNPTTAQQASNANTIAIGKAASATDLDALALGNQAQANKQDATAIGRESVASAQDATAMGRNAQATANYAQALGVNAQASGIESIAQGRNAAASAEKALAVGSGSKATEASASAFGSGANAAAENASAFGVGATAQNRNSVAIGAGAQAQSNRSVALGDGAVPGSATGTSNATVNGLTYGGFAGTNPVATVSVGTATEKRTITNVAAGRISSTSTDAINGSQLYITNNVLGNVAKSTRKAIGGETTLNANGTITTNNVGNTGENNIHDAIEYAAQGWNVQTNGKVATKVAPGETVNFADGKNIKITNTGKNVTVATADDVNFNTVNVDETVTIGGDTTNQTVINKGDVSTNNLTVNGTTKLGDNFTVNNDNSVTYKGQEIANKADGLSFQGNTGGVIEKTLGDDQPLTLSGQLAATEASSGANLRVDSQDGNLNLVMARDLTDLDSATFGKAGNRFTINQAGVQFVDAAGDKRDNTPSITAGGIDGGQQQITGVESGLTGTTLEGATGDTLNNAVNVGDLQNNITGVIDRGFNISADNSALANGETVDNVKLGETVSYTSSDGNIITTVKDNEIDFGLGNDLSVGDDENPGNIIVKGEDGKDGVTINGADGSIGLTGQDGANGTITVKNGVPGVDGQDGITRIVVDDVEVATMQDGLKFAGNTGSTINKQLNETLTVKGELADNADASGANLRVDSTDGSLNLVMAKNLTDLESITINNGGPILNKDGIDMGGNKITKVAAGTEDDDAVNFGQLNKVSGDVNKGLNFTGDDTTTVINRQLGQTLNITGGATGGLTNGNIGVVANGNQLEVKMAENIDLGNTGSVTMGDSVVNNDGLTIAGGPSVKKDGIDAGDKKITGVAKGDISKDSTDAVNGSQLWEVKNDIDKDVAASKTEVTEGKNITVTETKGADGQTIYEVATSDEVAFDKVDVGSVSIDKSYVDEDGNTIITGVGAGKADTDAVNVGQLKDVVAGANKGFNISAQGKNESNVGNGGSVDFNNTDGNIKVEKTTDSNDISFNLNPNLDLGEEGSVTTGNTKVDNSGVTTGNTTMSGNGITITNANPNADDYDVSKTVSVTDQGLNNGGNRITNVGPGISGTDAVNVNQLKDFGYDLSNKIDNVADEANAGVSSAMAMASLPQAYIPGKSMITGGIASYNGQGAAAVGLSKLSDNGRWVLKMSGSADTEGNVGGAVGAGFHF